MNPNPNNNNNSNQTTWKDEDNCYYSRTLFLFVLCCQTTPYSLRLSDSHSSLSFSSEGRLPSFLSLFHHCKDPWEKSYLINIILFCLFDQKIHVRCYMFISFPLKEERKGRLFVLPNLSFSSLFLTVWLVGLHVGDCEE